MAEHLKRPAATGAAATERVRRDVSEMLLRIERGGEAVVVPFSALREKKVVRVEVGGSKLLVRWRSGVASSLDDAEIADGRDEGTAEVRERGRLITFDQPFWFAVAAFRPDVRIVR
jgi:hypothetical protein